MNYVRVWHGHTISVDIYSLQMWKLEWIKQQNRNITMEPTYAASSDRFHSVKINSKNRSVCFWPCFFLCSGYTLTIAIWLRWDAIWNHFCIILKFIRVPYIVHRCFVVALYSQELYMFSLKYIRPYFTGFLFPFKHLRIEFFTDFILIHGPFFSSPLLFAFFGAFFSFGRLFAMFIIFTSHKWCVWLNIKS